MDIKTLVIYGVIGGALGWANSASLRYLHKRSIRNFNYPNKERVNDIHQKRELVVLCKYDELFDSCIQAINGLKGGKIKTESKSGFYIYATTSSSWKTFGDVIEANFTKLDEDNITLTITSRPKFKSTAIDYGKNYENIEKICEYLRMRFRILSVNAPVFDAD